jgi:phospholipid/cholesterol/gamma-HCH transport system permease protein
VVNLARYGAQLAMLLYLTGKSVWHGRGLGHRDFVREIANQIYYTGVQAVPAALVIALGVGVLVIAQGVSGVGALSSTDDLGRLATVLVIRELAPLITGIVVIARSVTAVSTELGLMSINREVEALEAMGIPPLRNLIAPRLIGGVTAITSLSIIFAATALVGGFWITRVAFAYLPISLFFSAVFSATSLTDISTFLAKCTLGGLGLFLVACYHGLNVARSPSRVPVSVSRAARHGLIYLLALHGMLDLYTLDSITRGSVMSLVP